MTSTLTDGRLKLREGLCVQFLSWTNGYQVMYSPIVLSSA